MSTDQPRPPKLDPRVAFSFWNAARLRRREDPQPHEPAPGTPVCGECGRPYPQPHEPAPDPRRLLWHEHDEPPAGLHEHGPYPPHAHLQYAGHRAVTVPPVQPDAAGVLSRRLGEPAGLVNDPAAMRGAERAGELAAAAQIGRELERSQWACEDCGHPWPALGPPPPGAECGNCGGYLLPREDES